MTKEQIEAIRATDATFEEIGALLAAARHALELEEALEAVLEDSASTLGIWRDGVKWHVAINGEMCGEGSTPLEAINNARRGM